MQDIWDPCGSRDARVVNQCSTGLSPKFLPQRKPLALPPCPATVHEWISWPHGDGRRNHRRKRLETLCENQNTGSTLGRATSGELERPGIPEVPGRSLVHCHLLGQKAQTQAYECHHEEESTPPQGGFPGSCAQGLGLLEKLTAVQGRLFQKG